MYLTEVPEQELWDIININVGAATIMSHLIIPQMKIRGRGAIVNVSSSAELQPLALMTVYAASKVRFYNTFEISLFAKKKKISHSKTLLTRHLINLVWAAQQSTGDRMQV